jgi:hypothetical protein
VGEGALGGEMGGIAARQIAAQLERNFIPRSSRAA